MGENGNCKDWLEEKDKKRRGGEGGGKNRRNVSLTILRNRGGLGQQGPVFITFVSYCRETRTTVPHPQFPNGAHFDTQNFCNASDIQFFISNVFNTYICMLILWKYGIKYYLKKNMMCHFGLSLETPFSWWWLDRWMMIRYFLQIRSPLTICMPLSLRLLVCTYICKFDLIPLQETVNGFWFFFLFLLRCLYQLRAVAMSA